MLKLRNDIKKTYVKYGIFILCMVLASLARTQEGLAPFHLGFYAALFYTGQNIIVLAPFYLLAVLLASPTWMTLALGIAPPIIFCSLYLLHRLTKRPIKLGFVMIYLAIAQIPQIAVAFSDMKSLLYAVATVIMAAIFAYSCSITLKAILVRGISYRFATDEIVGLYAIIAVISMGLFNIDIFSFRPLYLFATVTILLAVYSGQPSAIYLALAIGGGAGAMIGNINIMAGLAVNTMFALIFIKSNVYLSVISFIMGDLLTGLFFNSYGTYHYLHSIAVILGAIIFILIPPAIKDRVRIMMGSNDATAVRHIIKRAKDDTTSKINNMSKVFDEIGDLLHGARYVDIANEDVERSLSRDVATEVCSNCPNLINCSSAMGGDVSEAFTDMIALAKVKEVTIREVTPFLTSRCCNINNILSAVNAKTSNYIRHLKDGEQISIARMLIGEQMRGISEILTNLSKDVSKPISFDGERENHIIEELKYNNIICREAICESTGGWRILLIVRTQDAIKPELISIIENILKCPLDKINVSASGIDGYKSVELIDKPKLGIKVGLATATKNGSEASGDTHSCGTIGNGKYILALSDGMGSGKLAYYNSCSTIGMIESYYRAGFNNNIILSLINKILAEFNKDCFTCLDMAILDLRKCVVEFIKLGGVEGLLIRGENMEIISGGALPLGIVEEAKPEIIRQVLINGDIIVMMSDGISDILSPCDIHKLIDCQNTEDMQVIAQFVLDTATRGGALDDSTIIVAKIYNNA